MPLKDYDDFALEPLTFPIKGKLYVVPPLGYRDGLILQRQFSGEHTELTDKPVQELWRLVMGPAFDEMVGDNVPADALARAAMAAVIDYKFGRAAAEKAWEAGIDPEALAAATAAATKKGARKKASKHSTSTAAARKTPSPASGSGTRTSPAK